MEITTCDKCGCIVHSSKEALHEGYNNCDGFDLCNSCYGYYIKFSIEESRESHKRRKEWVYSLTPEV